MSHKNQLPLQYSGRIPIMRNEELFEIENYKREREGGREEGRERIQEIEQSGQSSGRKGIQEPSASLS